MKKIGFATYRKIPALTADDLLAAEELRLLGFDVVPIVWDDPTADLRDLAAVVTRSCWDYHLWPDRFRSWLDRLDRSGIRVLNPSAVVRWNMDKRYLRDLAAKGVALPRTVWVEARSGEDLEALLEGNGFAEAVVKPAISLSAYETWRTSVATARSHQDAFERLVSSGGVLVQELVEEVVSRGEISFLFFGGEYSHAVLKRPKSGDFRVQEDFGGSRELFHPPAALVDQARSVLDLVEEPLAFARVDGIAVGAEGGRLCLMELELIDPVLFLAFDKDAPRRFAEVIAGMLETH